MEVGGRRPLRETSEEQPRSGSPAWTHLSDGTTVCPQNTEPRNVLSSWLPHVPLVDSLAHRRGQAHTETLGHGDTAEARGSR